MIEENVRSRLGDRADISVCSSCGKSFECLYMWWHGQILNDMSFRASQARIYKILVANSNMVADLQAALALDPSSQETIALVKRAELILKKFQQKEEEEREIARQKAERANSTTTRSTWSIRGAKRMTIEEVEEAVYKVDAKVDTNPLCDGQVVEDGEVSLPIKQTEKSKPTYTWPSNQHKGRLETTISPSTPPNKITAKKVGNKVNSDVATNGNTKAPSSTSKPVDALIETETTPFVSNSSKGKRTEESKGQGGNEKGNDLKDVDHVQMVAKECGEIVSISENHRMGSEPSTTKEDRNYPKEICEAIKAQESIPEGHIAFGKQPQKVTVGDSVHTKQKGSQNDGGSHVDDKPHSNEIVRDDDKGDQVKDQGMLADEWRLTGNSFYAHGDVERAEECYTTSLNYVPLNPATLSNRAMCRLKLKRYKGAEEDASEAIAIDKTSHKAYFRRGLAHRALKKLEAAQADFKVSEPSCFLRFHKCFPNFSRIF